jgi:hypothetical protein
MPKIIRLKDCPTDFLTRRQGEKLRAQFVRMRDEVGSGEVLTIDFDGVEVMTPSFADECFGKFAERIGLRDFRQSVSLVGANETIRTLVNSILAKRILAPEAETA